MAVIETDLVADFKNNQKMAPDLQRIHHGTNTSVLPASSEAGGENRANGVRVMPIDEPLLFRKCGVQVAASPTSTLEALCSPVSMLPGLAA